MRFCVPRNRGNLQLQILHLTKFSSYFTPLKLVAETAGFLNTVAPIFFICVETSSRVTVKVCCPMINGVQAVIVSITQFRFTKRHYTAIHSLPYA